jgi:diaminopimelate decarboxylase
MPPDEIAAILKQQGDYPHLKITGIHIHIGSQLGDVQETVDAIRMAA